jgi:hypothetical protein
MYGQDAKPESSDPSICALLDHADSYAAFVSHGGSPFSRTGSLDNFMICVNASPPSWHTTLDNLLQRE